MPVLGAARFGAGEKSLLRSRIYREAVLGNPGLVVDTKLVNLPDGETVKLVLWDIAGSSALSTVEQKYIRGAAAYLLVVDGTRADTLKSALELDQTAQTFLGSAPRILIINKHDLKDQWEITEEELTDLTAHERPMAFCSALTGEGVESTFTQLAQMISST